MQEVGHITNKLTSGQPQGGKISFGAVTAGQEYNQTVTFDSPMPLNPVIVFSPTSSELRENETVPYVRGISHTGFQANFVPTITAVKATYNWIALPSLNE